MYVTCLISRTLAVALMQSNTNVQASVKSKADGRKQNKRTKRTVHKYFIAYFSDTCSESLQIYLCSGPRLSKLILSLLRTMDFNRLCIFAPFLYYVFNTSSEFNYKKLWLSQPLPKVIQSVSVSVNLMEDSALIRLLKQSVKSIARTNN